MKWLTSVAWFVALSGSGIAGCLDPADDFTYDSSDWTADWSDDSANCTGRDDNVWRNDADPPMDPDVWFIDHH